MTSRCEADRRWAGSLYSTAEHRSAIPCVGVNTFFHWFGTLHAWAYRHNGRLGRRLAWVPCLVLRFTGRNSGARRESVLAYADDGERRGVVASNGGSDRPTRWQVNLLGEPSTEQQL